jgi:hypothetical protein
LIEELRIDGVEMALVAGELGDDYGAPLQWHRFDESVLASADSDRTRTPEPLRAPVGRNLPASELAIVVAVAVAVLVVGAVIARASI